MSYKAAGGPTLIDLPSNLLEAVLLVLQEDPCTWAAAAASCKALHLASKATLPLPLLTVSPSQSQPRHSHSQRRPSLQGLRRALEFLRGRGEGRMCRKLVISPATLPSCSQELVGVLQSLSGQALPEELEVQWLGPWLIGGALHSQEAALIQGSLAGLTGLRQLHLQLHSTGHLSSGLDVGVLSNLQRLEDLDVEMQASHASVSLETGPLASLTRLSLTHTPPPGRSFVVHGEGLSVASIDPEHLPALRLLQLGSWSQLTPVGVAMPEFQQEAAGAWRVPEVELRGPAFDCKAFGLQPQTLSAKGFYKLPEVDYTQLTRLHLDRVCRLQSMLGGMPSMPRLVELHLGQGVGVEMLEGAEAGRQEVDLLIAACPTLAQVTGGGGMLSYEQLKAAGGLGDMEGLDAMFEDPAPAPVDPEVANAIFQHFLAAGGILDENPADGEGE